MRAENHQLLCKGLYQHMMRADYKSASVAGRRVQPGCWPVSQQCSQQRQGVRAQSGNESAVPFVLHCSVSTRCLTTHVWLLKLAMRKQH